jgi:hypothetical protein
VCPSAPLEALPSGASATVTRRHSMTRRPNHMLQHGHRAVVAIVALVGRVAECGSLAVRGISIVASSLRDAPLGESRRDSVSQPRVGAPAPTLGAPRQRILQPQRGCSLRSLARARWDATLSGLSLFPRLTQGSSRTRNPGLDDGIPLGFWAG